MHIAAKTLGLIRGPWSVGTFVCVSKLLTQCSRKSLTTVVAAIFVVGIVLTTFRTVCLTKMYQFSLFHFGRSARMSMVMSSSGSVAGNRRGLLLLFSFFGYAQTFYSP